MVRGGTGRKVVLLVASYIFYMWWNPAFILLLFFSTVLDYFVGIFIGASDDDLRRKRLLLLSVGIQLGLLAYFKYAGLFTGTLLGLAHDAGFAYSWRKLDVLLPVGISFYTFQTLSYTIDVYRRKLEPTHSFLDFALFIAFFPHLVAGPIIRAAVLLPQLQRRITVRFDSYALFLIMRGLGKKVLIADNIASFPNAIFADPRGWSSIVIWIAVIAFAVQIYCDFSGYSDIAIGILRVLGFDIPKNFDRPYFASSPADFWRRWHISLSTWLREYLYIPLGGNRGGTWKTCRNLMITMTLGGLWHGANWNFILWGALHGTLLIGHRLYVGHFGPADAASRRPAVRLAKIAGTQYLILLTWIFFRVGDLPKLQIVLRKFVFFDFQLSLANRGLNTLSFGTAVALISGFWLLHTYSYLWGGLDERLTESRVPVQVMACILAGMTFYLLWPLTQSPFIYFQF